MARHDGMYDMQVGYSAPAQAGIVSDIGLSNSEVGRDLFRFSWL
jgi:hypothetical protein